MIFPKLMDSDELRRISTGDFSALTESVKALRGEIKSAQRDARAAAVQQPRPSKMSADD